MRILNLGFCLGGFFLVSCATLTGVDSGRPSVANTDTVMFIGKTFTRKLQSRRRSIQLYEYFPAGQNPEHWLELVDFEIFPLTSPTRQPVDYARRVAQLFHRQFPRMPFTVSTGHADDSIILVLYYPVSVHQATGKKYREFSAFKFFQDSDSGHIMCFHYAKNIEAAGATRSENSVNLELENTRTGILKALTVFPLYRP